MENKKAKVISENELISENEWCEYSGMPSPLFYEKSEDEKNAEEKDSSAI